ncbi:MAG: hypothetical protein JWN03_7219 [Nocardia sp.]|uniref:DUF4265 domain-containing protein n=1 Tax=Nocardia sp. TaxID=1821 RepID=UPI00260EFA5F|nr:DUF4265 domain-containing protein [Nocardia sp.]MCU1646944.1 hypothetical protein [Nocardia sp.]
MSASHNRRRYNSDEMPVHRPGVGFSTTRVGVDQDGWPPVGAENLWAMPSTEPGVVELDNIPWFVRGVSAGDLIQVCADSAGLLRMTELVAWSGNCTIRVVPSTSEPSEGSLRQVIDNFVPLGADGEGLEQFGVVALNVPPDADIPGIKRLLQQGEQEEAVTGRLPGRGQWR